MASQFSTDLKYFAQLTVDGKLKLWNTSTNKLEQEFTPDFHLTSPCMCLHFVNPQKVSNKSGSPNKKIRRLSGSFSNYIVLGTKSGKLLVYSITKGDIDFSIDSETNKTINCISWKEGVEVYSAADRHVQCWSLEKKLIKSKWKAGNEVISSILVVPNSNRLLTASKTIKLWNRDSKELLQSYTGHRNTVSILQYVDPGKSDAYFISGAKGDKILSCWNLNSTTSSAVANFLTDGIVTSVSIGTSSSNTTIISAVTTIGSCHIFQHVLNGKGSKPVKPVTTVQVVSDTSENMEAVTIIPIVSASFNSDSGITIAHGSSLILTFEEVKISGKEKIQCLVRKDPKQKASTQDSIVSKIETPITNNVDYIDAQTVTKVNKRKTDVEEISMEKQLEKLQVKKIGMKTPKTSNMSHLLVQGLHSKDRKLLQSVFCQKDETIVKNTIERLPIEAVLKLVSHLSNSIQGKTDDSERGVLWLKHVLQIHAGAIISHPLILDLLNPILVSTETKLNLSIPLYKLKGRLNLITSQIDRKKQSMEVKDLDEENVLLYTDYAEASNEIDDVMEMAEVSESEEEYDESDSEESETMEVEEMENGNSESEKEMET